MKGRIFVYNQKFLGKVSIYRFNHFLVTSRADDELLLEDFPLFRVHQNWTLNNDQYCQTLLLKHDVYITFQ